MRCKVDDLVVVVRSAREENVGRLGRIACVSPIAPFDWVVMPARTFLAVNHRSRMLVEASNGTAMLDEQLRPLRDEPGPDETLSWLLHGRIGPTRHEWMGGA